MRRKFKEFWDSQNSFESKIYWIILLAGTIVTFVSIFQTLGQNLGIFSLIATVVAFLLFAMMLIVSFFVGVKEKIYMGMCLVLYFFVLPFNYMACGGVRSGMPCYYLVSVILPIYGIKGTKRYVTFIIGAISLSLTMIISAIYPNLVAELSQQDMMLDNLFSFLVCGLALFIFSDKAVRTYADENLRANKLQNDFGEMTVTDELTKLYKRRVFFNSVSKIGYKNAYIITLDIEGIKEINDTYGYHVGDRILVQTAEILLEAIDTKEGEFASRYGGDDLAILMFSENETIVKERINDITDKIRRMEIPGYGGLKIYANTKIIVCDEYDNPKEVIKAVDDAFLSM